MRKNSETEIGIDGNKIHKDLVSIWSLRQKLLNCAMACFLYFLLALILSASLSISVIVAVATLLVFICRNWIVNRISWNKVLRLKDLAFYLGFLTGFLLGTVISLFVMFLVLPYFPKEFQFPLEYLRPYIPTVVVVLLAVAPIAMFVDVLSEKGLFYVNLTKSFENPEDFSALKLALEYLTRYLSSKGIAFPSRRLYVYLGWKQLSKDLDPQRELLNSFAADNGEFCSVLQRQLSYANSLRELGIEYKLTRSESAEIWLKKWYVLFQPVAVIVGIIAQILFLK